MFTRDQIEEIKKKLIMLGTKDTQFPDAHKLNGEEIIAIVQDGENKKIPLSSIINDDFINVSKDTTEILTLSTAVSKIDINNRKLGQVITFKDSANSWAIRQFTGSSLDNWNDISLWKSISGIDELKSQVETNAEDISVLSDEIERHDASILNLNTDVSKLTTRVDILKSQTDTNTSNISSLNTEVPTLQSKVDVVGEKLTELKEKVDTLGKFYGYFPDSTSLPTDVTTSGYAYVGLDNPYKIWNFNGESWSDSGTSIDMNDADEEDITRNADGKLQFKDRAYGDGMGYVILRKDKTFAEQVTKANTIYEIRYDFDLEGVEITIPQGCILDFKGGSIINGTINGEFNIIANSTIFKNIDGSIKTNIAYSYYCGTTSADINKCLNLFECNEFKIIGDVEFNETIIINKPINLTWENGNISVNNNDKIVFIIYPVVKNVAMGTSTILYKNVERENPFIRLYGAGERGCDSFTKYELPTIKNDANLYLTPLNGLGVELLTTKENQYLYNTYIQIYCEKLNTALKITVEEGSTNITDNTFDIVSWNCTNGIVFDNTLAVNLDYNVINLMFQSSPNVEKVIKLKYPEKKHKCLSIFNISLWDTHLISHTNLIDRFEKATYNNNIKQLDRFCTFYANKFPVNYLNKTYSKELLDSSLPCISDIQTIVYCILQNISKEDSREDIVKKIIYNVITQFDYNITIFLPYNVVTVPSIITSILDKVIYNHDTVITNTANLKITISGYNYYNAIDFEINGVDFIFHTLYNFEYPDNITNYNEINITRTYNKYIGLRSDNAPSYATYDPAFLDTSIYKDSWHENYKFAGSTEIDELGRNEIMYKYLQTCDLSTTKSHNRFVPGYMFFNTDKNKLMIYKGNNIWSDALGNDKDTKGLTSQRPVLTSTDEGFEYYDTTLKKKILWNGTEWTNIDGTSLE